MKSHSVTEDIENMDNQLIWMKKEIQSLDYEMLNMKRVIKKNKIFIKKQQKIYPQRVCDVSELFGGEDEDGNSMYAILKNPQENSYLVPLTTTIADKIKLRDSVSVVSDSKAVLNLLPKMIDFEIKKMEMSDKPVARFVDVGGLNKQIEELIECLILPLKHKEKFDRLGLKPSRGILLYGPPGNGKTLLARACATETESAFFKLSGSQLFRCKLGDGPKMVRNLFSYAKEKQPSIIFIDDIDAIGKKRHGAHGNNTLIELLNQIDGFNSSENIKLIAATNRIDLLDPALIRSGRFDKKIEITDPEKQAREEIMKIHSKKLNLAQDVNFQELASSTDNLCSAQCAAVCAEATVLCLERNGKSVCHSDFIKAIMTIQKKTTLNVYIS